MRIYTVVETEIGKLFIVAENQRLSAVHIGEEDFHTNEDISLTRKEMEDPLLTESVKQVKEYFAGDRTTFNLPLERDGTVFQVDVWKKLEEIPYGKTKSYQEIAQAVGRPKAVRAIGQANKANKLPIIVPCHRVIGKNQTLTGYAGTRTEIKDRLLTLEGAPFKADKRKA
ncbi:methylated-DNA--[protein]-cysteine S-methyltransferase [Mesobacillus maritimus]|uniref:methylated-DNA--[protein]-cysteine S-methyltransferase n=1 Tax=Mesobacillus maritimus TaxID=1643336 RepID=UPI00384AD0F0